MADLQWTDEPPEEPGYYWIDIPDNAFTPSPVWIWDGLPPEWDGTHLMHALPGMESIPLDEAEDGARWAGPIRWPDKPV